MPFRNVFAGLFTQDTAIASGVFALVAALMAGAAVLSRRRRRRGLGPSRRAEANKLEIGYVAVLAGVAVFLGYASLSANAREFPDPAPALRVQVTAYQWCWRFHYEGQPVTATGQCQGGSLPTLTLPAGRTVELDVTSVDVVHAFWVPYLDYKMYAYPGRTNSFTVTPTQTGQWIGRCAQLCGLYHYEMDFYLHVVSPAAFNSYLRAHGGSAMVSTS